MKRYSCFIVYSIFLADQADKVLHVGSAIFHLLVKVALQREGESKVDVLQTDPFFKVKVVRVTKLRDVRILLLDQLDHLDCCVCNENHYD